MELKQKYILIVKIIIVKLYLIIMKEIIYMNLQHKDIKLHLIKIMNHIKDMEQDLLVRQYITGDQENMESKLKLLAQIEIPIQELMNMK